MIPKLSAKIIFLIRLIKIISNPYNIIFFLKKFFLIKLLIFMDIQILQLAQLIFLELDLLEILLLHIYHVTQENFGEDGILV